MLNDTKKNKRKFRLKSTIGIILAIVLAMNTSCNKNEEDDIRKLEELKQSCIWSIKTGDVSHIHKLKNEALRLDNNEFVGTSYYYLAKYYEIKGVRDSISDALEKAKMYFRKAGYKRGIMLLEAEKIHRLLNDNSNELAFEATKSLSKELLLDGDDYVKGSISTILGTVYLYSNKPEEALKTYQEALEAYYRAPVNEKREVIPEYNYVIYAQAVAANKAKMYELSLSYCDTYATNLKQEMIPETLKEAKLCDLDILKADNLLCLDSINRVGAIVNKVISYVDENPSFKTLPESYSTLELLLSKYYLKIDQDNEALKHITAIDSLNLPYINYMAAQNQKADIYLAKGDYKTALSLKNELIAYSDSIKSTSTSKQIDSLKDTLRLEAQAKENELNNRYTRTVIISLSIVCVLLVILLWITKRNAKRVKRKNELIFAQFRDLDKYTDKVKEEEDNLLTEVLEDSNSNQALFENVKSYLSATESFRNPDISRESLAIELGTNRQYLTEAIQENTGMTFMEYITEMRLEYARRLLSYNTDLPIDEVYVKSGFNSKSTFYRLFKQKYDLTPKEVRGLATHKR